MKMTKQWLRQISQLLPHNQGCGAGAGSGPFWSDPEDPIGTVLWLCKVLQTRKKYLKNWAPSHFQVNFSIFQVKKSSFKYQKKSDLTWKNFRCLNCFLVSASRIRIRFVKFWLAGSGSGQKWTGSATLLITVRYLPFLAVKNVTKNWFWIRLRQILKKIS